MITFNIHGSCVSRDIFEYDTNNIFQVKEYISRNSIFSAVDLSKDNVDIPFDKIKTDGLSKWNAKNIFLDSNKLLFKKLSEIKSDYLLIDLVDERFNIGIIEDKTFTLSVQAKKYLDENNINYDIISFHKKNINDKIDYLKLYAKNILEIYRPSKIILYKTRFVDEYIALDGTKNKFPEKKCENNYVWLFREYSGKG